MLVFLCTCVRARVCVCVCGGGGQGGHWEFGGQFEACARRECAEECGLELTWVRHGTTLNIVREGDQYHYVVVVMVAETAKEPRNMEPEKCLGWSWHQWSKRTLPTPLFSSLVAALESGFNPLSI